MQLFSWLSWTSLSFAIINFGYAFLLLLISIRKIQGFLPGEDQVAWLAHFTLGPLMAIYSLICLVILFVNRFRLTDRLRKITLVNLLIFIFSSLLLGLDFLLLY